MTAVKPCTYVPRSGVADPDHCQDLDLPDHSALMMAVILVKCLVCAACVAARSSFSEKLGPRAGVRAEGSTVFFLAL